MKTKPAILPTFANPKKDLKLGEEYEKLRRILLNAETIELANPITIVTSQNISDTFRSYLGRVAIFHFAGHGAERGLTFDNFFVDGVKLNDYLALQKNLRLVFLNACYTQEQAENLIQKGIPVVIGTTSAIPDRTASEFAEEFYRNLVANKTIKESFEEAKSIKNLEAFDLAAPDVRHSRLKEPYRDQDAPWQIYYTDEEATNWRLSDFINEEEAKIHIKKTLDSFKSLSNTFDSIPNKFGDLPDSFVARNETQELYNWIKGNLKQTSNGTSIAPVTVLSGKAGSGKTVVMKELWTKLLEENIPVLALKADQNLIKEYNGIKDTLELPVGIQEAFRLLTRNSERVVILIDQIDALSLSLSADRSFFNIYKQLISTLSVIAPDKIRIVISCREYDLKYDKLLKGINYSQQVKLKVLSEGQVQAVLEKLQINKYALSPELLKLLRVPLHLDIFCRIDHQNPLPYNITSLQELYG